jgi:CheY-like chemotaxis protein
MDVRGAVGSVAEMVRVRAEEKGLVFTCVVGDDVPEAIGADEKKLRQILLNLLSNAVKFTSHGTVSLLVKLVERGDEAATLRFEVHDSGPGIAEEELERIFHPFEQGGEVRYREGGTGLGLTISRQLAAVMGAAIEVRSRPGQGTTFWFEASFPHAERAAGDTVDGSAHIVGYAGRRRRVLVVDDHEANCDLLCGLLRQLGFETDVAHDGGEAVALAQRVGPDLVLMDLNMPVVDGHEAIRRMRSTDSLKATPIVAVSATHAEDGEASSRAAGADDFIAKPVDNGVLLAAIGRLLELEWTGAVPSAERRTAEADRPLRILAAEDNVTNQLILRALLGNLNADLQVVPNGVEAVGAFRDHSFDVVLMDVQMPGMSGVEATRVIREFEAQTGRPRTPIIALSADVMAEQIEAFQAAGMDTHVAKPIEIEQLYGVLAQVSAGGFRDVPLADAPGRSRQTG